MADMNANFHSYRSGHREFAKKWEFARNTRLCKLETPRKNESLSFESDDHTLS
jgi:hypothetical protein